MKRFPKLLIIAMVIGFALPSYAKCRLPVEKNDEFSGDKIRSTRKASWYFSLIPAKTLAAALHNEGGKTTIILYYHINGLAKTSVKKGSVAMFKTKNKDVLKLKSIETVQPDMNKIID